MKKFNQNVARPTAVATLIICLMIAMMFSRLDAPQPVIGEQAQEAYNQAQEYLDTTPFESDELFKVDQGDMVYFPKKEALCTVGYIDKEAKRAYLSGHCMVDGVGSDVYLMNNDRVVAPSIGKIYRHPQYGPERWTKLLVKDLGYVQLNDTTIGENIFSGDTTLSKEEVKLGDGICTYGGTTHETKCGTIYRMFPKFFETNIELKPGDSGGPMWAVKPDGSPRGLIGINSFWQGDHHSGAAWMEKW